MGHQINLFNPKIAPPALCVPCVEIFLAILPTGAFFGIITLCPNRGSIMPVIAKTALLLTMSNVFMTFAWYSHLKNLNNYSWYIAAFASWGIALFEYLLQVPANRIGYSTLTLPQLKIMQEVITLSVFVPFAMIYMKESLKWNYLWAGLCMVGAVYFIFKG